MNFELSSNEQPNIHDHVHVIDFYINGEQCETTSQKLTGNQILELGGFIPTENYHLIRDNGNKPIDDMNQELPIHKDERFTAVFNGPTPVS